MKIPGEPVAGRIVGLRCDRTFGCRGCLLHIDERSAIITVHFVGRFIEGQRDLLLCGGAVDGTLGVVTLVVVGFACICDGQYSSGILFVGKGNEQTVQCLRCGFDGYYALRLPDLLQIGQTGLGCQIDRVVIVAAAVDDGGLEFDRGVRSDRITVAGVVGV